VTNVCTDCRTVCCTVPPNDVGKVMAISKLKNGKAKGHDQMPAELITERGQELKKVISKIWEEETIPHEWKYGIICPIHKEGDEKKRDEYRVVTLLRTTYKIPANVLYVKLVHFAREIIGEYQAGFQREGQLLIRF